MAVRTARLARAGEPQAAHRQAPGGPAATSSMRRWSTRGSNDMDLYILLGLERSATIGDVKRAYKRLARRYHPDINPGDRTAAAHFLRISEAYETLSDPERRRRYDTTGRADSTRPATTYGFEGFDFSAAVSGAEASTFGELFADIFQQREARRPEGDAQRGADLHQTITLSFLEAMTGGQRSITVTRQE